MRSLARLTILFAGIPALFGGAWAHAQDPAVQRGVQFLRTQAERQPPGESALAAFAMVKAGVKADDAILAAYLRNVDACFASSGYTPARPGPAGLTLYEATVIILLYVNLDPAGYRGRIEAVARYILQNQTNNGGWDYGHRMQGDKGDTSISQYAILGLWEAENAGVTIPARVWDRAAKFFISKQSAAGGWNYHRDEPGRPDSISMTAAGVGSLLICKRQLEKHGSAGVPTEAPSSLLKPVLEDPNTPQGYRPTTTTAEFNASIRRGLDWISARWRVAKDPIMGESVYYGLYGLERIGALSSASTIGSHDWFNEGSAFILANQLAEGSWNDQYNPVPNTSWAILFLTKSTEKSVRRVEIERLGAGTLIGGRGLPKDLSSLTLAGGRVLVRPMNGAIDEMLAVLEDSRAEQADEALAGLVERYHTEGPAALRPHKARFRKLLADPDPGIRSVAAWGLGRSGDLDVAPDLMLALEDPEDVVVAQARDGLRLLSRKVDDFGPPGGASIDEKRAAAGWWSRWYESIRPPDFIGPVGRTPRGTK